MLVAAVFSFQLTGYFGDGRNRMICIFNRFSVCLCVQFSITIAEFNTLLKHPSHSLSYMEDGLLPTPMGESSLSP